MLEQSTDESRGWEGSRMLRPKADDQLQKVKQRAEKNSVWFERGFKVQSDKGKFDHPSHTNASCLHFLSIRKLTAHEKTFRRANKNLIILRYL